MVYPNSSDFESIVGLPTLCSNYEQCVVVGEGLLFKHSDLSVKARLPSLGDAVSAMEGL